MSDERIGMDRSTDAGGRRGRTSRLALVALTLAVLWLPVTGARAFNGGWAADYADTYARSPNRNWPLFDNDCANFTSQVMRAGGYPMHDVGGSKSNAYGWWLTGSPSSFSNSRSWSFVVDQRNFLILDYPGGIIKGTTTGNNNTGQTYWQRWPTSVGLVRGDLLYFDWGRGEGWSHVAVLVVQGGYSSGNGWYGDLVDAHNNNRYHAFWDLSEYNVYLWTTNVNAMHIAASN